MRLVIVIIMVLCLWVCTVPFSHTEPAAGTDSSAQAETPVVVKTKTIVPILEDEPDLVETLESIHAMTKSAQVAAKTIGRTLGQYVREKYNQQQQREILTRFDAALRIQLASLSLTPAERAELTAKIEEAYIRDSETNTNQLDQNYFHDLGHVVKKEYSELRLAKTPDGTVQTFDYDGNLKTKWTLQDGIPQGPVITYYSSGEIKFIDLYENGERVSRKKYDEEGKLIFEQEYSYEKKPEPVLPKIEEAKKEEATVIPKDSEIKKEETAQTKQAAAPVEAFAAPAVKKTEPSAPVPAAKQSEAAVAAVPVHQAEAVAVPQGKASQPESVSFAVPVNYRKEGESSPAPPASLPPFKQLAPEDGKIEVIFKETRTQSVQNEAQSAGTTAVSAQTKSLL